MDETVIAAIDLGTTHSLSALWRQGRAEIVLNALGQALTPSVVSVDGDGSMLVGQAARERLQSHPERTASAFKRAMGTAKTFRLDGREYRAEELSSLVLRSLKADLEAALTHAVREVVVTVPAYFSQAQREATKVAARLAGFEQVSLLNEPTAAALAYGLHQKSGETKFLVFDLGGGTFDVSILEMFDGVMEVRATAGDNQLGGDDVDQLVLRHVLAEAGVPDKLATQARFGAHLLAQAEAAKKALAVRAVTDIDFQLGGRQFHATLAQAQLEDIVTPLMERMRVPIERAMRDAGLRAVDLEAVVLAGGSTRLVSVRQWVTRLFGRFPDTSLNPDEVVVRGAAVQAGLRMKDVALSERVMTDVCPYTLGVEVSREVSAGRQVPGFMAPVIDRNTAIPASRVQNFSPVTAHQRLLEINVYQGEARRVADNISLGKLRVPLAADAKNVSVDVRFTYDVSGLLEVEATPCRDLKPMLPPVRLLIDSANTGWSADEIVERLAHLKELKIHPREQVENRTIGARAERLHSQLLGLPRERLAAQITRFEASVETQDGRQIDPARKELVALLDALEDDYLSPGSQP